MAMEVVKKIAKKQLRQMGKSGFALQRYIHSEMIDNEPEPGMAFGDAADHRQKSRRIDHDGQALALRRRPDPIRGSVGEKARPLAEKDEAQPQHAGLLAPRRNAATRAGRIDVKAPHDGKAVWMQWNAPSTHTAWVARQSA